MTIDSINRVLVKLFRVVQRALLMLVLLAKRHYLVITGVALIVLIPALIRSIVWVYISTKPQNQSISEEALKASREKILNEITVLDKNLEIKKPKSYYLIINSASNEFSLFKGNELIKKDKCSTGSYVLLKNGNDQQWMFKTPKGEFRIQGKTTSPVWKKPDWAFIEEGLPVPPANHHSRFESGVLGDYALSLGDGYLIHGTLYQRFIGLPVTHGCIRLNDDNLKLVYNSLKVGSKVYIY